LDKKRNNPPAGVAGKILAAQGDCCASFILMPACSFCLRCPSANAIPALHSLSLRPAFVQYNDQSLNINQPFKFSFFFIKIVIVPFIL